MLLEKNRIEQTTYDGLDAIEFTTSTARLVLVTGCGPRIAHFGTREDNFLYWEKDAIAVGDWKLHGGHRVWITRPMADEAVDAYMADNDPCRVEITGDTVTAISPPHPIFKVSRGMRVQARLDGSFGVTNFITNHGPTIFSGGVWSPTCINPAGKQMAVPLGEDTSWDIVKIIIPRRFMGNTVRIDDPQVTFTEHEMLVTPAGVLTKRCVKAPQGIVYATWAEKGLTFTKHSPFIANAPYPLDGCNIAVFVGQDNWMAEMETFGPEQPVIPGQTIENTEIWSLTATACV